MPQPLPHIFNIVLEVLAIAIQRGKEIKGIDWKGKTKTVPICSDMIFRSKTPRNLQNDS